MNTPIGLSQTAIVDWEILLRARYTLAMMTHFPSYAWYGQQWQELGDLFMNLTGSDANADLCWAKAKEYISRQAPRMPDGSFAETQPATGIGSGSISIR